MNNSSPRLDTQRHSSVFDTAGFVQNHSVCILGAGNLGSRIARQLAKLGVAPRVYDGRNISEGTGIYEADSAGNLRVEKLAAIVKRDTGLLIDAYPEAYTAGSPLARIVYLCTDNPEEQQALLATLEGGQQRVELLVCMQTEGQSAQFQLFEPLWRRDVRKFSNWIQSASDRSLEVWQKQQAQLVCFAEFSASLASMQTIAWYANQLELQAAELPADLLEKSVGLAMHLPIDSTAQLSAALCRYRSSCSISVIGAGALGSRVARQLASLGLPFELFDFDEVEAPNVANQAYGLSEIGQNKAEAFAHIAMRDFGQKISPRKEKFDGTQALGEIVFVCPDNMACRRLVWECVRLKANARLLIEARMGDVWGKVYTVSPRNPLHLAPYQATLHSDKQAVDNGAGACRASVSVGPSAEAIASRMVGQFLRHLVSTHTERKAMDQEIIEYLRPYLYVPRRFTMQHRNLCG